MDTVHCILVCVMCPPGQGCRSWYVMSNQKFNVPELVRLHERSTVHEDSSITARWILEVIHYGLGTLVDFFPPRWLNHLMAAGLVLDRLGPTLGYFILQSTYGLLDGFIGKGPDTILHTFSHYLYIHLLGGRGLSRSMNFDFMQGSTSTTNYLSLRHHGSLFSVPYFESFGAIVVCTVSTPTHPHYHQPHSPAAEQIEYR